MMGVSHPSRTLCIGIIVWQFVFLAANIYIYKYIQRVCINTGKSFPNLIKSNRNQIVFTMHRLIWQQTDVRLVPNLLVNGKYNLISVWFNKIWKRFPCVQIKGKWTWLPAKSSKEMKPYRNVITGDGIRGEKGHLLDDGSSAQLCICTYI